MGNLDVSKLISNKSIIFHNLYGDGRFIKCHYRIVYVQFDYDLIMLNLDDYQKSWYVKNYSGYQIDGSKLLDTSRKFEQSFLHNTIYQIENKLKEIEEEIFSLPDLGYGPTMNKTAKQKGKLEAQKSALIPMKWRPYFARIDLIVSDNPETGVSYYISGDRNNDHRLDATSIMDLDNIVDWRSQEAVPYYDQEMYSNDECENKLVLLRDYEIKNCKLVTFADNLKSNKELIEQVADERLKEHIRINRDNNVRNIIQTIKTNQYRIISHNHTRNILVQGCAGSGKTMILAHRLTFWLFRLKDEFDIKNAYIVSPTKLLSFEMTQLDLNINQANFMSNFEFNKYLIEYICSELGINANLESHYLSNNLIHDDIIKKVYSARIFDDYKNIIGILEEKEDDEIYNNFIEYTKFVLNKVYNTLFKSKQEISIEKQIEYEKIYDEIKRLMNSMTYLDLLNYKNSLEVSNSQFISIENELKVLKKKLKEQKIKYSEEIEKVSLLHNEFKDKSLEEVIKILHNWKEDLEKANNEIIGLDNILEDYGNKYEDFDILRKQLSDLDNQISKAGFFERRRLERDKHQIQTQIRNAVSTINNEFSQYNITINTDIIEIKERIKCCTSIIDNEYLFYNRLNDVVLKYNEVVERTKYNEEKYESIDKKQLEINKKHIRLANQLIKFSHLLSSKNHENNEVSKVLNQLIDIKLPNNTSVHKFITIFNQYYHSQEYLNIKEYIDNGNSLPALMTIIEYTIQKFKDDHHIDDLHYEFEVFLKLYFLYDRDNIRKINKKWIFIDEFQDYSYWEIEIYRNLFSNTSFNYFGDMKQNINAKGLGQRELEILTNKKFDLFEINENYRNAKEITEYVNQRMNSNMYSIGLKGKVEECSLEDFFHSLKKENLKSTAIIVTNEYQKSLISSYKDDFEISFVNENDFAISNNKINVLTPLLVKGLEFDVVCVFEKEMSENEKYVSFTRALSELYVIREEG